MRPISAPKELTETEREVMLFMAEGVSSIEIAIFLGTTVRTVELSKLNLPSVIDLVQYVARNKSGARHTRVSRKGLSLASCGQ